MTTFTLTMELFNDIYFAATIKASRNALDLFADRIRQAATEPHLLAMAERLMGLVGSNPSAVNRETLTTFLAAANAPDAAAVLAWIRRYPRIVAMIAALRDANAREEAAGQIVIEETTAASGQAIKRRPFEIGLSAILLSPLAHGGDEKAGNATLFRRMDVLSSTGSLLTLPFYAGNALRGQMRDLLADHLLGALGIEEKLLSLWFFHVLYAGGALEENSAAARALGAKMGKETGGIRPAGIREFRDLLPSVSLLGCSLGNRVLPGRINFGDLRPCCREWGTGDLPVGELMEWTFLTRREDNEEYAAGEHSGMIASTECLKAGVWIEGGIGCDGHIQPLERAALGRGLLLLAEQGKLGAENRRGLGSVLLSFENCPDPSLYDEFLATEAARVREYLDSMEVLHHARDDAPREESA